jgi:hypothetical protein
MPQMLEQLQLSIRPLAQHGGRKGFHDFLDGYRSSRQLILGGTTYVSYPYMDADARAFDHSRLSPRVQWRK